MAVRLLIIGGNGLLGHALWRTALADSRFSVAASVRRTALTALPEPVRDQALIADVAHEPSVASVLDQIQPGVVINCTGVTKHKDQRAEEVIQVNSLAPHLLARLCAERGARIIHISTDCVFSGCAGNYHEEAIPDPVDLYGRSKLLGEVTAPPHLTIRTSFIGRELETRRGLLEWFLHSSGTIQGYRRAIWSGLTSTAFARVLLEFAVRPEIAGLLHVGGEPIDKFSLLSKLQRAFNKDDVDIAPVDQPIIDRSLDARRFAQTGIRIPPLDEMIRELAGETHP